MQGRYWILWIFPEHHKSKMNCFLLILILGKFLNGLLGSVTCRGFFMQTRRFLSINGRILIIFRAMELQIQLALVVDKWFSNRFLFKRLKHILLSNFAKILLEIGCDDIQWVEGVRSANSGDFIIPGAPLLWLI